jgi:hypothetical protein
VIAWLHPAALVGLLAVALPVVVHLLRRERARRVIVPSLRFVRASERSAVRLRTPSDPWLLLLRIAIVASAALAAARPLLLTDATRARWDERVARAVVVDASASVRGVIDAAQISSAAASASPSVTIEAQDLGRGIARAMSWLATAPPARREIVILSDFQRGALSAADLDLVPDAVGVRLVPVRAAEVSSMPRLGILGRDGAMTASVTALEDATAMTYEPASAIAGLEIASAPEHAASVERLMRIVGAAGAIAPSVEQPIVIRFAGSDAGGDDEDAPAWVIGAGARLLRAPEVQGVDLRVSSSGDRLVVDVNAAPDSLEAALAVKAALDARLDPAAFAEAEPQRIAEAALTAWSRAPGPADVSAWRHTDESDGRWLWALALVLLGVEAFVRRTTRPAVREKESHAA